MLVEPVERFQGSTRSRSHLMLRAACCVLRAANGVGRIEMRLVHGRPRLIEVNGRRAGT